MPLLGVGLARSGAGDALLLVWVWEKRSLT
jgi:hypothetical protein